jgi:hypothetical protein
LTRQKTFRSKDKELGGSTKRLTGSGDESVDVSEENGGEDIVLLGEETGEDRQFDLHDIPSAEGREEDSGEEQQLFISGGEPEEPAFRTRQSLATRRERQPDVVEPENDDKKKLGMKTTYDGFRIHGRILCLVVKRKGTSRGRELAGGGGQAMMEEWIASTQMQEGTQDG